MIIHRKIVAHLKEMLEKYPVVSLTGPRQSGKTTILRSAFSEYKYFNLERIDIREMISADPLGFLKEAGVKVIFDEAQNLPELFSYIQVFSDERRLNGQYILSGSQSFLLNSHISQSLAGRVSVNVLLPFDVGELSVIDDFDPARLIISGFYPRTYDQHIRPSDFYPSYLQTYIERDIRTLRAVENLQTFSRFLGLCAGRTGQIVNLSSLANDAGVSVNTVKAWLSLLESSYIIYLLQPYHHNFSKRIIKSPKLYFYDTGIVSSLLRINDPEMLSSHYLYGALFENLVISEIIKSQVHRGERPSVWYWRESNGQEIDCIVEREDNRIDALEIKAGQTFSNDYLRSLKSFPSTATDRKITKTVIYQGTESTIIKDMNLLSWHDFTHRYLL
ncbi:MAG: ATP-binding protein [Bacteroidales bacterium]|jgi:predicted AAA+ superfamily ATPase|nr:ATP-binding protein [Bacteroidales bacterium]